MNGARCFVLCGALVVTVMQPARGDAERALVWEPYSGTATDGSPLAGELGRIRVPESRNKPGGPTVEIAFVRYRTDHPNPAPPIFFLAGGPGGSGVEGCEFVATHPYVRFLEHADVIGIDQRGTGRSFPNLSDPDFSGALPLDRAVTREETIAAWQQTVRACVRYWTDQGVDLTAYNTRESADDVDDVRRALALDTVVIYGASYGAHLSLAYLRRHGEHVARAVISRVEGPNHTWKLPSTVQRCLATVHDRVASDPRFAHRVPDLIGQVADLLDRLERDPVEVTLELAPGETKSVTIGPYDVQRTLARDLAFTRDVAGIPAALDRMCRGDWSAIAQRVFEERRFTVGSAMALMMDCASGATRERLERIAHESRDPRNLLGDAITAPWYPEICDACGNPDVGDEFRRGLDCDVPVLFVSGDLDVRTPPDNVEEIRGGFSNHVHVVAHNAGHDSRELMAEEFRDLLNSFLRGETIESCTIDLPFLFEPLDTLGTSFEN